MSAEHYADVDLTDPDWPTVRFVCTGGDTDLCHQWCAEGCEEQCLARRAIRWSPEAICQPTADAHRWEPSPRVGESSCRIVDWLDAIGWQESGWVDEPDDGGEREVTAADLRPGQHLIAEEWTGDDYIWRYPANAETTAA
jgi:hypothetical protein